jgi:hypothetical protein
MPSHRRTAQRVHSQNTPAPSDGTAQNNQPEHLRNRFRRWFQRPELFFEGFQQGIWEIAGRKQEVIVFAALLPVFFAPHPLANKSSIISCPAFGSRKISGAENRVF